MVTPGQSPDRLPAACRPSIGLLVAASILGGPAAVASGPGTAMRWPLDRTPGIVSSFGEYRYDHLHGGIDISTGGATGLKVRAAEDGQIVRLKVEWRGYGRALYLRHAGGRSTVYAHLERYEDAALGLERLVARRQSSVGTRYPGDIYLDPAILVRRGQVIAYSGESGAGPPHLHFEVRGPGDQPLDPFRAGLRAPADRQPPVLEAVTITAADPATYIDGVLREKTYPLERQGARHAGMDPVRITGPFQATLSAYDPVGGGRVGLRFLEVLVDGRPSYRLDFDDFRFDQSPLSGLIHDHRFSHLGPTRFGYRLSRLPGNALAAGPRDGGPADETRAGSFDLAEGVHRLDLVGRDAAGMVGRAHLCVFIGRPDRVAGARLTGPAEALPPRAVGRFDPIAGATAPAASRARSTGSDGVCAPPEDTVDGEIWSEAEGRFLPLDCRPVQGLCFARAPLAAGEPLPALRLRRITGGVPGPWQLVPEEVPAPVDPMRLQVDLLPAFIDLRLPAEGASAPSGTGGPMCPSPGGPSWRPREGRAIGSGLGYEVATGLPSGSDPVGLDCLLRFGLGGVALKYVSPSDAARLEGGGFRIDMPAGARFYPGPLAASTAPPDGLPPGLRPIGVAVDVLPEGEALNARATLSFDLGEAAGDARALGIFRYDPLTARWNFDGDSVEAYARTMFIAFRRHGRFALLRDEAAPVVTAVRPGPDAGPVGRHPDLLAKVDEVGKGLGPDGVSFVLDGATLESEFDPDRGTARPLATLSLTPGRHHLRVVATDRAGNISAPVESRFEVR